MMVMVTARQMLAGLLLGASICTVANAGATISFGPGPDGSTRINTPWGVFVSVATPNGIWVGTEEELIDAKAREVMRRNGDKEVRLSANGSNQHTYVSRGIEATVGSAHLYDIQPYALIGYSPNVRLHRPVHPKGTEYFGLFWVDFAGKPVTAQIVIDGKAISPFICEQSDRFRDCEFHVPIKDMAKPAAVYFLLPRAKPSAILLPSLARGACDAIQRKHAHDDFDLSADDRRSLEGLRKVDPTLPNGLVRPALKC